jgi:hypothetical protein
MKSKSLGGLICGIAVIALPSYIQAQSWHNFVSLGLGITQTGHSQDLTLIPNPFPGRTDRFVNKSTSHLTAELSGGSERLLKSFSSQTELWIGGEAVYLRSDGAPGQVLPSINVGNFDRLNFSYDIDSYLLLAKGKIKRKELLNKDWGGYIDAGIGVGFNRLSNYTETIPPGSTTLPMQTPFAGHTRAGLAYSLGFGITRNIGSRSEISLGYRYINSGKGSLGTTPIQTTSNQLQSRALGHHLLSVTIRA